MGIAIAAALVAALLPLLMQPAPASAAAPAYFTQIGSAQSVQYNGYRYFFADDDRHGVELWRTDGTSAGTSLFLDLNPGDADSDGLDSGQLEDHYFVPTPAGLYLVAGLCTTPACSTSRNYVHGIYRVDVSARSVVPVLSGTRYDFVANLGSGALLTAFYTDKVFAFDSKTEKLTEITGFRKLIHDTLHRDVAAAVMKGVAYFPAEDASGDRELWRTDGTQAGTYRLKNIRTTGSAYPGSFVAGTNRIYFLADDGFYGSEIWTSDGTATGTVRLTDHEVNTGSARVSANPPSMVTVGDRLYYNVLTTKYGMELWTTGGTRSSVKIVRDLGAGTTHANIKHMTKVGSKLAFFRPGTGGDDVWMTNGTSRGTTMVASGAGLGSTPPAASYYRVVKDEPAVVAGQLLYTRVVGLKKNIWQSGSVAKTTKRIASHTEVTGRPTQLLPVGTRLFYTVPTRTETFAPTHYLPRFATITALKPPAKLTKTPVPKISGTATVGKTLTAKAGTWAPAKVTLKYQWLRSGKAISKATKSTYKLVASDKRKKVTVKVTGSKSGYTSVAKTSAAKTVK